MWEIDICDFSSLTLKGDNGFRSHRLLASSIVGSERRPALAHRINLAKCHKLMVDDLNIGQNNTLIILVQNVQTKQS